MKAGVQHLMQKTFVILLFLVSALLLHGCGGKQHATSEKGAGGLPKQQFDSSENVIPWEIPEDLKYPNWTQFYPDNNRIYLHPDTPEKIAEWYMSKLPNPTRNDVNGKRHIVVFNKEIEVDIESGGDQTKIAITPLTLGLKK